MAAGFCPTLITGILEYYVLLKSTSAPLLVRRSFSAAHTIFTKPPAESVTAVQEVRYRGLLNLAANIPVIFKHVTEHARAKLPKVRERHASSFDDSEHLAS